MTSRAFVFALLALAATLGGCTKHISDNAVETTIDDNTAVAINVARQIPEVTQYMTSHPPMKGMAPLWSVYHDEFYPTVEGENELRLEGQGEYVHRPFYCNDEYVVSVDTFSARRPHVFGPTVRVNIRNHSSTLLSPREEYATPAPMPTPCLDGSKPLTYSP